MTLWRSSLLALTAAAGLAGGATLAAADGPSRGGEWPNIPWTWSGYYAGLHIGNADTDWDSGMIGGAQVGRNWQSGKMVYGVEGDVSLSDIDSIDWFATARGRFGYLFTPNVLGYGTAGIGFINFNHDHHGGGDESELVLGLGVEGKITQTTSVRLEYLNFTDTDIDMVRAGVNWKFNW